MTETPPAPEAPVAPAAPEPEPQPVETDSNARTWGMLCHLSTFAGCFIPFGNIVGPLVVWLVKREEMPFVDNQGKEALNFQITVSIAMIISGLLTFVCVGFILMPAVAIVALVFTIIAAVKANKGIRYRYPLTIRMIK